MWLDSVIGSQQTFISDFVEFLKRTLQDFNKIGVKWFITDLYADVGCNLFSVFADVLDRIESFERSDVESADSLDTLDTYTLTTFLGQNIVSKPQSRQRKRRLRHSTAGTGPRTTNSGNIITARCRPQSTSVLPPQTKPDPYPQGNKDGDVWQRADIGTIQENPHNTQKYNTPPPPPPPVVQMPSSVSGSVPSVTESPARLNGNHAAPPASQRPRSQAFQHENSPVRTSQYSTLQHNGHHHISPSLNNNRIEPQQFRTLPPQYQKRAYREQHHKHNVISDYQPKKPPRTFEATEGRLSFWTLLFKNPPRINSY